MPGHIKIITFQENDTCTESFLTGQVNNFFYELLPLVILRMGLSCNDNLHRVFGVIDNSIQTIRVSEQEGGSLVSGKPAGKTDRQGL